TLEDGTPAHSFSTLMAELATLVRNTCRTPRAGPSSPTFEVTTAAGPKHQRALDLLQSIQP
ncbi:MAG: transposase, partial [Gammaproteobacteria bacterium]